MEMSVNTSQSEYNVEVRGWDGHGTWKEVDARVLVHSDPNEPTVVSFTAKTAFTIDQLKQIVSDLEELEGRSR